MELATKKPPFPGVVFYGTYIYMAWQMVFYHTFRLLMKIATIPPPVKKNCQSLQNEPTEGLFLQKMKCNFDN
jgi:hypothetical protein